MKKIIMALVVLGLMAASSTAAITYQNNSVSADTMFLHTDATNLTTSLTAGSGNYVVVAVATKSHSGDVANPVSSVTYNGTGLTVIGSYYVDDSYEMWAILYGGIASAASGNVVVNYQAENLDDHDGLGFVAASWSGATGIGAVSLGNEVTGGGTGDDLTDSIITTEDGSVIVSSWALGSDGGILTSSDSDIRGEITGEKIGGALTSVDTTGAGAYDTTLEWTARARRAGVVSVELVPEPATVGMLGLGALVALLVRRIRM